MSTRVFTTLNLSGRGFLEAPEGTCQTYKDEWLAHKLQQEVTTVG